MQTSDLNVNNTESDHATAIFCQLQDAIFSREHTSVKASTKIIFDLLQCQEVATLSLPKKLPSLLSSQEHFAGILASEPMTLPEIDHVSFLVEHAQTFFAGEPSRIRLAWKILILKVYITINSINTWRLLRAFSFKTRYNLFESDKTSGLHVRLKSMYVICLIGHFTVTRWKRGWIWPCFDTTLAVLLCKSYVFMLTSIFEV